MSIRKLVLVFIMFILISSIFNINSTGDGRKQASESDRNDNNSSYDMLEDENETGDMPVQEFDKYFLDYLTVGDIETHVHKLAALYPKLVQLSDLTADTDVGATWQGRTIWGVKISDNAVANEPDEPKVLIIGNVHAREWMAYEAPMYFMYHLLENYGKPPTDNDGDGEINEDMFNGMDDDEDGLVDEDWSEGRVTWLVNNREIWIVPTLNPDGTIIDFEMQASGSGSWRKNARDNNGNGAFEPDYDGVDLNRNFAYMWDSNQQGIVTQGGIEYTLDASNPTSGVYRGPQDNYDNDGDSLLSAFPDLWDPRYRDDKNGIDEDPWDGIDNDGDSKVDEDKDGGFSEPETQALERLMERLDSDGDHHNMRSDVGISIAYHSVGGWVIWPWGYTKSATPHENLMTHLGQEFMDQTGYASWEADDMYMVSGDSADFLYGTHGVMAYTFELNHESGAGFHPPKDMIINTTRRVLTSNLYATEWTGVARVAKDANLPDLDIGLPEIYHDQEHNSYSSNRAYKVVVEVTNPDNLNPNSMLLHYRVGNEGIYRSVRMKGLAEKEVEDEDSGDMIFKREFSGSIPAQPSHDGKKVYYYITGEDVRGLLVSGPAYGEGDPYVYKLDSGFDFAFSELAAAIIMTIIFIAIVWGGFFKGVTMAIKADKRKARQD